MFGAKFGFLTGLTALMMGGNVFATPGNPVDIIRKKDSELQKMLHDKESAQKTERLKVLINGIFDFEELGKRALGMELWKTMPVEQQARFVKAFKAMVENASVKKLEVYQSDSTSYEPPDVQDAKATVTSHMFTKGTESIVTYKLLAVDSTWKAWDLIIDDLSTARNYGEQFRKILQTSDMNALISKLEKKSSGGTEAKPTDSMKAKSEKGSTPTKLTAVPKKTAAKPAGTTGKTPADAPASKP